MTAPYLGNLQKYFANDGGGENEDSTMVGLTLDSKLPYVD